MYHFGLQVDPVAGVLGTKSCTAFSGAPHSPLTIHWVLSLTPLLRVQEWSGSAVGHEILVRAQLSQSLTGWSSHDCPSYKAFSGHIKLPHEEEI